MKNPQIFNKLAKNRGTKALALLAVFLLVMQPFAFAMDRTVYKYPSDSTVAVQDIGNAHPLDIGSVFNFNNAKAPSIICLKPAEPGFPQAGCTDNLSLSEIDENNCDPESTIFPFGSGADGWEGANVLPSISVNMKFLYDATNEAINVNLTRKNQTGTFEYNKKFFYECGTPGMSDFKIRYRMLNVTGMGTVGTNYFKVDLIKPLGGIVNLVPSTNVLVGDTNYLWKPGPASTDTYVIPTTNWNESGVYTIKISGQLKTGTAQSSNLTLQFDDITLNKTSLWTDYRHDVEYFVKAAPYSQLGGAGNGYILEIKAAKKTSGADNANVLVYNGASWTNKGSISQTYNNTLPQNNLQLLSIPLTDAEYNNGLVRVRYVDATQSGDLTPGGVYIDYQRIKVDQGICVQEVRAIEADCGKCHNYSGDVTKPWPAQGMHNKHAQTETVSDCTWCHPDVTAGGTVFPSDHMNGLQAGRAIEVAGSKIFRTGGANPQGAVGSWDPATGQCTLSDCHNGLLTPSWIATYGATNGELNGTTIIARNCSRCHNTGVNNSAPAAADVNNLNIAAAWPDTLAHREHDNAFNMDENSCQANGSCHPDNRVQHTPVKDTAGVSTLMSPKYQSPSGSGVKYIKNEAALPGDGDGRCYNATCHGGQETPKWNATVGSLDPSQPNSAYCKACHKGEKASTWTPGAVLPDISAKQYNSPISGLHQGSPPTSGKSHVSEYGCAVCHTINPTLHFKDGVGTTNLDSWQMDPVGSAELVATMGYGAVGKGTPPSYTDGNPPTCATPYPGPNNLACHAESDTASLVGKLAGTNTPWERDWSWDAYSSTAADRCKVCHGVYGSFKTLRPAHTSSKLAGNHSDSGLDCATTCHAQTDNETIITTNIYNHGVSLTADAKTIDVNMNVGFTQSTAMETTLTTAGLYGQQYVMQTGTTSTVGCTGCHVSTGSFAMQESGWKLRNQLTGPAVTCDNDAAGCHGNNTANQVWPDGTGGAVYPDRVGKHQQHMTKLAAKLNITLASATEAQQKQMCTYCHGLLATIGASGHTTNGTANQAEASGFLHINAVADAGTAATYSNDVNATCSGIDCHNNQATTATYNWRTGAASTCTMCHTPGGANTADPTSGLHNNTLGLKKHDSTLSGGCGACHTMPAISNLAGATHINGTFTANNASNNSVGVDRGVPTTMYSEITPASGRSGSCAGTGLTACHADTGKWSRLWSTEANSALTAPRSARCNVCHGQWSTIAGSTGWAVGTSHYKAGGTNSATNARGKIHEPASESCDNCHAYGASGAARHNIIATPRINVNNNGLTPARTSNVYGSGTAGCTGTGTCHAGAADTSHNFPISQFTSTYVAAGTAFPQPVVNCGTCHTGGVTRTGQSGAHSAHGATSGLLTTNPASVALCIECHGHNGSGAHSGNGIQFATVTVTGTGLASTCSTSNCHNRGAEQSPAWSATQLDCNDCHYYPGALTSATPPTTTGNNNHLRPLTGSHSTHFGTGTPAFACSNCHTVPGDGDTAHINGGTATNADRSSAAMFEATVLAAARNTGVDPTITGSNATCNNATCHNPSAGGTKIATWGVSTSSCTLCHGNSTTPPPSGDHPQHTTAANGTFGRGISCVDCHVVPVSNRHRDGAKVVQVRGTNGTFATVASPTIASGCGTNECHNNGSGGAPSAYTWGGTTITDCTECHNAGLATLTTNAHNEHLSSYSSAACTDCHTAATASATHLNRLVNIDGTKATYSLNSGAVPIATTPSGTCSTASCHNKSGGGSSVAWNVATGTGTPGTNDLACTACHYYPGILSTSTVIAGSDTASQAAPTAISLSHRDHLTKLFQCSRCHTVQTTTAHITGKTTLVNGSNAAVGEAAVSVTSSPTYTYATSTCTNGGATPNNGIGCHATGAPVWGSAITMATGCTSCHTNTTTAAVNPTSGLHNITVGAPVQRHDATITGGCAACHSTTPPGTHINGSFTANGAANGITERFINRSNMTYAESAITLGRSGSCTGTGLTSGVGCHSDNGNWNRLWSTEANSLATATSSQRCNVCHGQWSTITNSTGWAAGTTHAKAGASKGKGHDDDTCNNCHLYGASGNGRHNVVTRQVNINSNSTPSTPAPGRTGTYPSGTAGCGACHGDQTNPTYNFPFSYFPVLNVGTGTAFIAPTCISCHSIGDNITTPLVSATSSHVKANGITFGACEDCHAKHADTTLAGSNVIYVSTVYTGTTAVPTMTKADGTTALYGSGAHGYRIRLGGNVQNGGAKSTEAEWCWGCHDFLGSAVLQAKTITFTATTIVDSGAGFVTAGFAANKPVKISGSSVAANNKWATPTTVIAGTMTFPAATFTADATAGEVVTLQNNVSEWRTNTNTATGSSGYDYGQLFTDASTVPGTRTSDWTTGYWRSGKGLNSTLTTNPYWYKRGKVRSTHSASYDGTTAANDTGKPWKGTLTNNTGGYTTTFNKNETLDAVANIRCSYCHDVHNNHNGIKGDPAQSSPYLRGSWRGNAYAEDGAPRYGMANWTQQSDSANAALLAFGAVPRASASTANTGITAVAQVGGFWIDQNSNNPTSLITGATALDKANNSAGLCEQCHGANKNGTWTAAALGTIDQITGEAAWVSGYNGHANSVLGAVGPGAAAGAENRARNIFTRTKRGSAVWSNAASNKATVDMGLATNGTARGYSYRSSYSTSTGYSWGPCVAGGTLNEEPFSFSFFAWNNVDYNSGSTRNSIHTGMKLLPTNLPAVASETAHDSQANYHTFTCSKCHNPHASRLPKLMITNCLDTNHNTWEDNNTFTGRALPTPWTGMRHSQWASAQNCHRLDARATGVTSTTTLGTGWTTVTPWIEDTAPNPASGAGKTADITTQLAY